ncbi:bacteriophage antitermination protein Q [Martelella alba]|uniref:Antitermination protein n=1 Tax=Martelella alba TaxID=2590451 RepID=A0ABY2SD87_9HYPH|nr:bacteriophage antitermination protein Q [Martelella alba]TKI02154.1 antitermination protein [Martelella alba]
MTINIEYIREKLTAALADIQGLTKGQLTAFEELPLTRTTRYKRHRPREGRVCSERDPIYCPETRVRKCAPAPIDPLTFAMSSYRRAVGELKSYEVAWIRYCYGGDLEYTYQIQICQYIWSEYRKETAGQKITEKVRSRLASLVWLAVQTSVWHFTARGRAYGTAELAMLVGVSKSTWSETYSRHWAGLMGICRKLDEWALFTIITKRSDEFLKQNAT